MRPRRFAILASVLLAVLVAFGGVLVADASERKKIPDGITIGGVDVGGMDGPSARSKVQAELLDRLQQPVRVKWDSQHWTLSPKTAKVNVDVDAAVDRALDEGKKGNAFSRVARSVTGGEVKKSYEPTSSYSRAAVTKFVSRVGQAVDRDPKEASVTLADRKLTMHEGRVGLTVRRATLKKAVTRALNDPSASHSLLARTSKKKPTTSTADVKKKYGTVLIADRNAFKVTVYKDLKPVQTYGISVGKVGHDTPSGQYTIGDKQFNPIWQVPNSDWAGSLAGQTIPANDPRNPIKGRWLGIVNGVGFHGTTEDSSIGQAASHGCLRMHIPDVKKLYAQTPLGSPVWIL